jgi:hypothetical protein
VKNACFLSYRHPGNERTAKIIKTFAEVLESRVCLHAAGAKVYLDDERLRVGDLFQDELASELCNSACMVMLFNRSYFDLHHHFCAREYKAMVQLEKQRLGSGRADLRRKGLILTVAFRDPDSLPDEIKNHRHYVDVSQLALAPRFLEERRWLKKIDEIAAVVADRYAASQQSGSMSANCSGFVLPAIGSIEDWLRTTVAAYTHPPMPGHE